jgi:hypothetical protein
MAQRSPVRRNGGPRAHAVATESTTELTKTAGGVLCSSPAKWIATYKVSDPSALGRRELTKRS